MWDIRFSGQSVVACVMRISAALLTFVMASGVSAGCSESAKRTRGEVEQDARDSVVTWRQKANDFASVSQVWDSRTALRVVDRPEELDDFRRQVFWLHDAVGACVSYKLESLRGQREARFSLMCQRGDAELSLVLDDARRFSHLDVLVTDRPATRQLRRAQAFIVGWLSWEQAQPEGLSAVQAQLLREQFGAGEHCRLGADLLVGPHEARTLLICDDMDDRVFSLRLDPFGAVESFHLHRADAPA